MDRRKLGGNVIGFAAVIVLVVLVLIANSLHRSSRITLPDIADAASSAAGSAQPADGAAAQIQIEPKTVQAAIATLTRPARYVRALTVETLWSGGSGTLQATVFVSDGMTRTDLQQADGRVRHTITDGQTTRIWYDGEQTYYAGPAGDITADQEQHIPTYEDILALDPEMIATADYRTFSDENCIYVETGADGDGYVRRYWVSVDSGLLVGAERLSGTETIYRMAARAYSRTQPATEDFTLPDGTVLHSVG